MMRVLEPTYTIRLTVKDPYRASSNIGTAYTGTGVDLNVGVPQGHIYYGKKDDDTGCTGVLKAVRDALEKAGVQASVHLEKFEHT